MSVIQREWLQILKPNFKVLPLKERLLCGIGALCGLAISSLISWYVLGGINAWYIAPMGPHLFSYLLYLPVHWLSLGMLLSVIH